MIASGGVSGGFSSMIAGGNFMDGFRQGIIVSGLNHVATMTGEAIGNSSDSSISNSKYDSLSDKQKSKYTQVPKDAIVEKIVQNIPTLSSNTMVPDVVITDTTEVWGETMWVSKKNLYRSIESSVQLYTKDLAPGRYMSILYQKYEYINSWFYSSAEWLGKKLFPASNIESVTIYKSIVEFKNSKYNWSIMNNYLGYLK